MKKLILVVAAFTVLALVFPSCKDDEQDPAGTFTFEGKTYHLEKAFAWLEDSWSEGSDTTYYDWYLLLTSKGIRYNEFLEEFEGAGDAIGFEIEVLNDDTPIPPGTYTWTDDTAECDGVYLDINLSTGSGDLYDDFEDVTITLTKSDEDYTIDFTVTSIGGSVMTGTYTGKVAEIMY